MSFSLRLIPEPVRSLAFGSIGAAYMGVGTSIDKKARMIHISNLTDSNLMFSFDGVNDHFPLQKNTFLFIDVCLNRTGSDFFSFSIGDRLYVKEGFVGSIIACHLNNPNETKVIIHGREKNHTICFKKMDIFSDWIYFYNLNFDRIARMMPPRPDHVNKEI